MYQYAFLALDLANERVREANEHRLARLATADRPSWSRRVLARLFAANGRTSMRIARRLDAVAAK